jgi:rfaE bifunctional protein nucleotidyltransferase chain/domain
MALPHHWREEKILTLEEAAERAADLKKQGKTIVSANGSFDIVHAGHLDLLEEARQQGDVLFVGLNSDASVRNGKGAARPYIPERERAALLAALMCVDYVVIVDAPYREMQDVFIHALKPAVHVNGAEYGQPEAWIEWKAMQAVGARGYAVERRPGLSTSDLITKIKAS